MKSVFAVAAIIAASLSPGFAQSGPEVRALSIDGPIGPPIADHIVAQIDKAGRDGAALVLIEMDTPGGLVESTRKINQAILGSTAPVAVYVTPAGARAASAGAYILNAAHIAAMAPGTNVGAATPVNLAPGGGAPDLPIDLGGGDDEGSENEGETAKPKAGPEAKAVNDLVASIRAFAELRGRNADLAEAMVREAVSVTATEALEKNGIDMIVESRGELLSAVDGMVVETALGPVTIRTAGAAVTEVEPGWVTRLLTFVTHPNVAFLLLGVGFYGIIIEFWNPGSILPGAVGAISLILGLYALSVLPVSGAAAALMVLGAGLAAAEFLTPTFGALAAAGLVAFSIGGVMLFPDGAENAGLSRGLLFATIAGFAALLALSLMVVVRGHRRRVSTGEQGMAGAPARVLTWEGREGYVRIEGERWRARGPQGLAPGDVATVERLDGLTLELSRGVPPGAQT